MEKLLKKVKFTPAQQKIVNQVLKGSKLWLVNCHYMNGGEYKWQHKNSQYLDYAGAVYKAFGNAVSKIRKQLGNVAADDFADLAYAGQSSNPNYPVLTKTKMY
mgnify:CR=1 FL=1